jgi:hypothetical protein
MSVLTEKLILGMNVLSLVGFALIAISKRTNRGSLTTAAQRAAQP